MHSGHGLFEKLLEFLLCLILRVGLLFAQDADQRRATPRDQREVIVGQRMPAFLHAGTQLFPVSGKQIIVCHRDRLLQSGTVKDARE